MKIILVQFQTGNMIVEAKQTRKLIKRTSKSRQGLCSLLFAAYLNFPYYIDLWQRSDWWCSFMSPRVSVSPYKHLGPSSRALWLLTLMGEKGLLLENLELWVQGTPIKLNEAPRLYRPKKDQGKLICLPRFYL